MKNLSKYILLALFFTFAGAVVTFITMMAFDNKNAQVSNAKNVAVNQKETVNSPQVQTQSVENNTADMPTKTNVSNTPTKVQPKPVQAQQQPDSQVIELKKGSPVVVYDFINPHQPMLELVPIYNNNNEIDKVAIYRFDDSNNKSLETMFPLPNVSDNFPPVSVNDATQKLETYRPNSYPQYQEKLVVLTGGDTPFYHFLANDAQGNQQTLLVDAYSGFVQKMTTKDIAEERKYSEANTDEMLAINNEGMLELNDAVTEDLTPLEQEFMQKQKAIMNEMIEKGVIKLDAQGNMIENNMTEAQFDDMDKRMRELEKKLEGTE